MLSISKLRKKILLNSIFSVFKFWYKRGGLGQNIAWSNQCKSFKSRADLFAKKMAAMSCGSWPKQEWSVLPRIYLDMVSAIIVEIKFFTFAQFLALLILIITHLNLYFFKLLIYLQPDDVNIWYFKRCIFDPAEFIFWNMKNYNNMG